MSEHELGKKVSKLLELSANENIKQSTLYRLQSARRAALEHCQSMGAINSGSSSASFSYGRPEWQLYAGKLILLLAVLLVLMSVTFSKFWDNDQNAIIDTMIMADDLPIDAYIDNEFEKWLNSD